MPPAAGPSAEAHAFVTALVHELRSPLAAIYCGAELLVRSGTPRDGQRLARNVLAAAARIEEILADSLAGHIAS